jgi:hypothetical protein
MKLERMKKRLTVALLGVFVAFGLCFRFPIYAVAESNSYIFKVDETQDIIIELTDEANATITILENKAFKEQIPASYTLDGEIITLTVNGEIYGVYDRSLPYGGTVEEPPEEVPEEETESEEILEEETTEEAIDGVLPKTEGTSWFEENIEPLLWRAGADVVALGTVCVIVLKRSKKAADSVNAVAGLLMASNDNNKESAKEMKAIRKEHDEWKKGMEAMMNKRFEEMRKDIVETEKDTNEVVHKLLSVEEIAYEENPSFVSSGTAKKIAEVIRYGESKT